PRPSVTITCTFLFFFSSRRRHTRSKRDWSSDVCSSDLAYGFISGAVLVRQAALLIFGCLPPVAWAVTGFKASHETGSTNVTAFHWPVLPNPLVPRSLVGRSLTSSTHGNSTLWITNCAMRSPGWTK